MFARAKSCVRVVLALIIGMCAAGPARVAASFPHPALSQSAAPTIVLEEQHDLSLPLSEMAKRPSVSSPAADTADIPIQPLPKPPAGSSNAAPDRTSLQSPQSPTALMPAPLQYWQGVGNLSGVLPPDTNGDVGPNHYVQWVNLNLAIWDKTGRLLYGPVAGNTIWSGFGGPCQSYNNGDPIVLYDSLSDRWFISQFALPGSPTGFYQCIAVSQTPNPTGSWYRYAFRWSQTLMNDYGKFGVWSDGYYMSVNQFNGNYWGGAGVAVFERDKMLQGQTARMITFSLLDANSWFGGMLPADLDGQMAPPTGAPNPFVEWDDTWINPNTGVQISPDELRVWNFHVDWNQPSQSTFGNNLQPNFEIPTIDVDPHSGPTSLWISQPGTSQKLDALSDRLMYRLQYRNFGDHQTLVGNHTVDADSQSHAGIHWFELRVNGSTSGPWALFQQGVLAPNTTHRWMGSLAMDGSGNIALGYSLSGPTVNPSIAYSGRLAADPAGTMPQSERIMVAGGGAQTSYLGRWGDYSTMSVDPSDDCTFWYTQEIMPNTSSSGWRTEIGSFRFPEPGCTAVTTGVVTGRVTATNGASVAGVAISLNGAAATTTDANGVYRLILSPGSYSISASVFDYASAPETIQVSAGQYTQKDFNLPMVLVQVSGSVRDGSGHSGMPLFARIDIPTYPASPVYTNSLTGGYQISLPIGFAFSFTVTAQNGGYQSANRTVTPVVGSNVQDFDLLVDSAACSANGYAFANGTCQATPGGLVVGTVLDGNIPPLSTPQPIIGATVSVPVIGASVVTGKNPAGGYSFFLAAGDHSINVTAPGYGGLATSPVQVLADQVVKQDFSMLAGHLSASPGNIALSLFGASPQREFQFAIHNDGTLPVYFQLNEIPGLAPDPTPTGPFAPAGRRLSPKRTGERSAANIYEYTPPETPAWTREISVLNLWAANLTAPWGLGVAGDTVWVGDLAAGGGDGKLHAFSKDGQAQPNLLNVAATSTYLADLAFDPTSGHLWQTEVSGDPCLIEIDPVNGSTGTRLCPPFGSSQRGLAYDPFSRTFFSGTWNDGNLSHFDRTGQLLDSAYLGINISGMAYHPGSSHLYILSNASAGYDVYVVEARQPYRILGGFDLPGLANFGQAGLDFDADGHLWLVDSVNKQVMEIAVGEPALPNALSVPWLTESITSGSLLAGQSINITVSVQSQYLQAPLCAPTNMATLTLTTNTPYDNTPYRVSPIPVTVTAPCQIYIPSIQRK